MAGGCEARLSGTSRTRCLRVVTDRPTNAHEKVFLLTKSAKYFYDAEAVRSSGTSIGDSSWAALLLGPIQ